MLMRLNSMIIISARKVCAIVVVVREHLILRLMFRGLKDED